jgi:predicted RNA-binding Zn ribbon-like protein
MTGYTGAPKQTVDTAADGLTEPGLDAARRAPAPGGLELVRAFLNTADIEAGTDRLDTHEAMGEWLRGHGLIGTDEPLSPAGHLALLELREAIRDLITCRTTDESPAAAREVLTAAARASPLQVAFGGEGNPSLEPVAGGVHAATARILAEVTLASVAGTWTRLKVCRNDACRWAYYDTSRNHSGVWCSMAVCGNRAKGRAYRGRRAEVTARPISGQ